MLSNRALLLEEACIVLMYRPTMVHQPKLNLIKNFIIFHLMHLIHYVENYGSPEVANKKHATGKSILRN